MDYWHGHYAEAGAAFLSHPLSGLYSLRNRWAANLHAKVVERMGLRPSDATAADDNAVLEFDKDEKDLARFIAQAISRFFATEQVFMRIVIWRHACCSGAGFLAGPLPDG